MKETFRFFVILAALLIPLTFASIKEKFPIMVGVTVGVTLAYWGMVIYSKRKEKKSKNN